MEKKTYKAIVKFHEYSEELKGNLFHVYILYDASTGDVIKKFDNKEIVNALMNNEHPYNDIFPKSDSGNVFYEVFVQEPSAKESSKNFHISMDSQFNPAIILYDNKWIRKNNNLFVSAKGIILKCKKLKKFIPLDLEESFIYSPIALSNNDSFVCDNGVINKYKLSDSAFLEFAIEIEKGIYVMSQSSFESIKKEMVDEIDFIDEASLKKWIINRLRNPNREEIISIIDSVDDDTLNKSVFDIRHERCKKMFDSFTFTSEEISLLFKKKNLKKEIDYYRNKKFKEINDEIEKEKDIKAKEIEEYFETESKNKLNKLEQVLIGKERLLKEKEIEVKKNEGYLCSLEHQVKEKKELLDSTKKEITSMSTTKEMIIEALKAECSNKSNALSMGANGVNEIDDIIFFCRNEHSTDVEDEVYHSLFPKELDYEQKENLSKILEYKASIVPNISYAYTLAHYITNAYLKVITVEHGWYHYLDFLKVGLLNFYNKAIEDNENNYIIFFDNINIVPIECSLKPLIEIIKGERLSLPGALSNEFPRNLRILASVLPSSGNENFGIRLNEKYYSCFHFVENPESRLTADLDVLMNNKPKHYVKLASVRLKNVEDKDGYNNYKNY